MKKYLAFIGLFAAAALLPGVAAAKQIAVSLTKSQVATVCNGANYCEKSCGLSGQNTCTFGCGSKGCSGVCQNCASQTIGNSAIHGVVGGTMSNAGSTAIRSTGPTPVQTHTSGATNPNTTRSLVTQPALLGTGGGAGSGGTGTRLKQGQGVTH